MQRHLSASVKAFLLPRFAGSIATHEPRVSDSEASVSEQGNGSGSGDETCLSANEETVDSVDAGHVTSPCDVQAPPCNAQAEEVAHHEQEKASTHLEVRIGTSLWKWMGMASFF